MAKQELTEQQRKWMASVRASLPEKTGKSMEAWVEIARACPESAPRARQKWFKEIHGIGVNYFSFIEHELRGASGGENMRDPDALAAALWIDPAAAAIFEALKAAVGELPEVVTGQREAFTAWSRRFQFASARPVKGGAVRLGLAVAPEAAPLLSPPRNEGWSERLKAVRVLSWPGEVDAEVKRLLKAAWEAS